MKTKGLLTLFLLMQVFVLTAQTKLVLQPGSAAGNDAIVHEYTPTLNYGNLSRVYAWAWTFGGTPGKVRSLLAFDLSSIPASAVIVRATLSLYHSDALQDGEHSTLSGANDGLIQRVTSPWEEYTVTWNTQPTVTTSNQVSLPASTDPRQDYKVNVTNLVKEMVLHPATNYGFRLQLANESYYRALTFSSSDAENPSLHPKLEVEYLASTPGPGTSVVRINAGGPAYVAKNGEIFQADSYFEGNTKTTPLQMYSIRNTADDNLYRTDRVGNVDKGTFRYEIPVTAGEYLVRLHFSENYFREAGKRVFSVVAEGAKKLTDYDIYAAVGRTTAVINTYTVVVVDGALTLDFSAKVNRAKINAIEVLPLTGALARKTTESFEEEIAPHTLTAVPNCFSDKVTLHFSSQLTEQAVVELYDLKGNLVKVLFKGELPELESQRITFDSSSLPAGVYLVRLVTPSAVTNLKVVHTN